MLRLVPYESSDDSSDSEADEGCFAVDPGVWAVVSSIVTRVCGDSDQLKPFSVTRYRGETSDSEDEDEISLEFLRDEKEEMQREESDYEEDQVFSRILDTCRQRRLSVGSNGARRRSRLEAREKGELSLEDLPPIETLHISLPSKTALVRLGVLSSMVDCLVVIQSDLGVPALDVDTVLFLSSEQSLGFVFEIFGPVLRPLYSVRFNSVEEIEALGLKVMETPIFFAPTEAQLTKTVFTDALRKLKWTDASWEYNAEPPDSEKEFSDDEEERRFRAKQRRRSETASEEGQKPKRQWGRSRGRGRGSPRQSALPCPPAVRQPFAPKFPFSPLPANVLLKSLPPDIVDTRFMETQ